MYEYAKSGVRDRKNGGEREGANFPRDTCRHEQDRPCHSRHGERRTPPATEQQTEEDHRRNHAASLGCTERYACSRSRDRALIRTSECHEHRRLQLVGGGPRNGTYLRLVHVVQPLFQRTDGSTVASPCGGWR